MADFQLGDVVMLKSGGPKMTIKDIGDYSLHGGGNPGAACAWFDGVKPMKEVFPLSSLEKVD